MIHLAQIQSPAAGLAARCRRFGLGIVVAQQPMPPTKVTQLMQQAIAEFPGHEVTMITLDIPPGGGSAPHRHPRRIISAMCSKAPTRSSSTTARKGAEQGRDLLRSARPASCGVAQCQQHRARQGIGRRGGRNRQAADRAGTLFEALTLHRHRRHSAVAAPESSCREASYTDGEAEPDGRSWTPGMKSHGRPNGGGRWNVTLRR